MVADINPKLENWKELIPEMESVLSSAEVIGGKLFLTYDKDASNHAYVYSQKGEHMHEIKLPSLGSVGFSGTKDDKECFFYSPLSLLRALFINMTWIRILTSSTALRK